MAREVIDIIIQERGSRQVRNNIREIGDSARNTNTLVSLLRQGLGALGAGFAIREVLRALDSYQRMQNQLRVVGYETNQLANAMDNLSNIANTTRTPLEETVNLYGRLAQSAGELGKTEAEMLRFTELTGKALAIQGTSTAGARAALLQLSQAMGEGIVRAQEYNSLVENARPLLLAAATGMEEAGGSVARLRSLVIEGKVTSEEFFQAVLDGGKLLEEQFGNTIPTIGQALTVLRNTWTTWIGESQVGQLILNTVSQTLLFIAQNFDLVAQAVLTASAAVLAYVGGGILGALITRSYAALIAQIALAGGMNLLSIATFGVSAALSVASGALRLFTAAIATNPLGALLVTLVAVASWLYSIRDRMVTVGQQTASVGSIIAEVWDRLLQALTTLAGHIRDTFEAFRDYAQQAVESAIGYFRDLSIRGRDLGNFLIAVFVTFKDAFVNSFRVLWEVAKAVFEGIRNLASGIFAGIGQAIAGDFAGAATTIQETFGEDNFNFDNVVKISESAATKIRDNFGRDWVGEIGGSISALKLYLTKEFEDLVEAASLRDVQDQIDEFIFETINAGGTAGDAAGRGKAGTDAYKDLLDELTGTLKELVAEQDALKLALAAGVIQQDEYLARSQALRVSLAEWYYQTQNLANATRDANLRILELKINAGDGTFADGFLLGIGRMTEGVQNFTSTAGSLFSDFFGSLVDGFSNSIGRAIVFSEDLGTALKSVAQEALASLISGLVKLGIQWALNAALGNAIATAATAATAAQATAAAAAWAPAAALASLATLGTNAAPANAAVAATMALTKSMALAPGFANGGSVSGPGGPRDDRILSWLSDGEFVVNARDAAKNRPLLEAINAGMSLQRSLPRYADGGGVKSPARASAVKLANSPVATQQAPGLKVSVQNYTGQQVQVERISRDEVRIIAGEVADQRVAELTPDIVSNELANPNSKVSASLSENTSAERKR